MALSKTQRYTYATGHFLNDLCAALWFTYLLLFLKKVIGFSSKDAGTLFLIGQCADGLGGPLISYIIDKFSIVKFYPRRKGWHLFGTVLVSMCFLFVLSKPAFGMDGTIYYYMTVIIVFQWGWAFVQLSHLSLIPCLGETDREREDLNSKRYGMMNVAFMGVYVISFIKFRQVTDCTINEQTAPHFSTITYICVACGLLVSILFHTILREPEKQEDLQDSNDERESEDSLIGHEASEFIAKNWYDWFFYTPTYIMAIVFLLARLANNTLGAYLTLYVTDTIQLNTDYIAILPFVQYLFGIFGALGVKTIAKKKGTPVAHVIGSSLVLIACLWVGLIAQNYVDTKGTWKYFVIFALFGTGLNMLVCSAYGLIAEFIGNNVKYSAFVYGIFGVGDKVLNGVIVRMLEHFNPCNIEENKTGMEFTNSTISTELDRLGITENVVADGLVSGECKVTECNYYGLYISRGVSTIAIAGLIFLTIYKVLYGQTLQTPKLPQSEKSSLSNKEMKDRTVRLEKSADV